MKQCFHINSLHKKHTFLIYEKEIFGGFNGTCAIQPATDITWSVSQIKTTLH